MFTPVIIGSSGWLASAAQKFFAKNVPLAEPPIILGSREGWSSLSGQPIFKLGDRLQYLRLEKKKLVVLHFAYLTQEKSSGDHNQYMAVIEDINSAVRRILDDFDCKALIYASSGAAGKVHGPIHENDTGKVLYGKLKARDEVQFEQHCDTLAVKFLSPRIFSLGGQFINKQRIYAISDFIIQALRSKEIKVSANRQVWRSYVQVSDLVDLLWREAIVDDMTSKSSKIFDVAHEPGIEIGELARLVAEYFGLPKESVHRVRQDKSLPPDFYVGDAQAFSMMGERYGMKFSKLKNIVHSTATYITST